MIKIIKPGPKEFKTMCPECGCVFSYELVDVGYPIPGMVRCPSCDKNIRHMVKGEKCVGNYYIKRGY